MPAKRNVVLLVDSFNMGGAESQLLLLARLLLARGRYGVRFACFQRRGVLLAEAERLMGERIPEFPLTSFYDRNMAAQLRRFAAFLRERATDVIHTDGFYTNVFGILGGALARTPARVGFRGETAGWRTPQQNFVERSIFRLASVVHANSQAVKEFLIATGVPAEKIAVIYNGLEMARVMPPPGLTRDDALALLGLPRAGQRRFVTIVANLRHEVKDHPMFLRAAQQVRAAVPEAAFVLAGEGELTDSLRALAAELGLAQDAFFIGRCDRIAELLFATDVCVLSSKAEGFSNAILEYMGAARPVVATDVGGAREAISEGETGYLVRSGDHATMAARIIALLRDPARARAMGACGQEVVRQKFSAQVQLERTQELYDRLLARRAARGGPVAAAAAEKSARAIKANDDSAPERALD